MKKVILIILSLFLYNITNAVEVEYTAPIYDDINEFLTVADIEPGYNPQPSYRLWIYKPYQGQGVELSTAEAYCITRGEIYISHTIENEKINMYSLLYFSTSNTWWDYDINILRYAAIICDDGNIDATTWTGSTFIINNIDADQGINKKIFDLETIKEIFEYEALIMVFILMWVFFMRTIWARPKGRVFNF